MHSLSSLALQGILESEPFGISIKDTADAKKLGEDFAKELGKVHMGMHPHLLLWVDVALLSLAMLLVSGCAKDDTSCVRGKVSIAGMGCTYSVTLVQYSYIPCDTPTVSCGQSVASTCCMA